MEKVDLKKIKKNRTNIKKHYKISLEKNNI